MSQRRGQTCMATFAFSFLLALLLIAFASLALGRGRDQHTSTVERVLQPQAAVQLEAQQLAAESAQAQRDAARAERRDWLLFVGALALAGMGALLGIAWLVSRRPQIVEQRVTLQLPPNTPPHLVDAQWRMIDAQMVRNGYELEDTE